MSKVSRLSASLISPLSGAVFVAMLVAALVWVPVADAQDQPPVLSQVDVQAQAVATPFKAGNRYFFVASTGGLYVKDSYKTKPRLLLRPNTFTVLVPSQNGEYLIYGVRGTGTSAGNAKVLSARSAGPYVTNGMKTGGNADTSYEIRVVNVTTAREVDTLRNAYISRSAWTRNSRGFFYVREDPSDGRQRVYYHRTGEPQRQDVLIFSRQDQPDWRYDVRVSDDGQYAVMTISHPVDSNTRMYFIDLDNPNKPTLTAPIVKLIDQFAAPYTFVDNGGYYFFLQTRRDAPNGHIVLANTNIIRETRWPSVVPQSADTLLFARTAGNEYVIAVGRNNGTITARVYSPPKLRDMQDAMRRQADSIRDVDGRDPQATPRGARDRVRQGPGMSPRGAEAPILQLNLTRELPIPEGGTLLDITSFAEDEELFYTVQFADGSVRAYIYNIKNRRSSQFDMSVNGA